MKRFITLAMAAISVVATAQTIDKKELSEIQSSFVKDASTTAIQNILTNDASIRNNATSNDAKNDVDHLFKYRTSVKGITNQRSSGRCWMFTSMNQLRPIAMEKYNVSSFDFSHNYNYFWDLFEKANLFLENVIRTSDKDFGDREVTTLFGSPVDDGGVWNLFYNLGIKYGVVPDCVMPETEHSNNTGEMRGVLKENLRVNGYKLREAAAKGAKVTELRKMKVDFLKETYRILALCLGVPPTEFTWRYQDKSGNIQTLKSTPKEFYESVIPENYNPNQYVMCMNDPTREYYKVYEIANYRNTIEGINWVYLNLPNEDLKAAALQSIKDDEPMYASCDVGKQSNRRTGIMDVNSYDYESLLGVDMTMDKKARILTRQSGSSHAMLLIACDTDVNDTPIKWQFENSWGPAAGHNGYMTFTDKWFDEYMFRLVLNRKYLNDKALKALESKPIQLPMWDYMF